MEVEHAFDLEFVTSLGIKTCPHHEWLATVQRDESKTTMVSGRKLPDIDALLQCNDAQRAKLQRCEVLSIVLYTGPMVSYANTCVFSAFLSPPFPMNSAAPLLNSA
jgi:hypothetical protein